MSVVRSHLGPLVTMFTDEQLDKLESMAKIKIPQDKRQKMKESLDSFVEVIKVLEDWEKEGYLL